MLKVRLVQSPDYSRNAARARGDAYGCICCGRPVRAKKPRMVYLHDGGAAIVTAAQRDALNADPATASGDLGAYPVGPDCLRAHPELREYL